MPTPQEYLDALPEERRAVIAALRDLILKNLPSGYRESINYGMLTYEVPLERYPKTYNKQPLAYLGLAAQKNYYSLYLMCIYSETGGEAKLREEFLKAGKKLDMGKSCLRFTKLEDLPLDVVAKAIASTGVDEFIDIYEKARGIK
jgi:hypothetical protein